MPDDWLEQSSDTGDSSYAVDKFFTGGRNKKGFASTLRVTVAPEVTAHIGELVASKDVPEYRTTGDFVRDSIVHRLHWINEYIANPVLRQEGIELRNRLMAEARMSRLLERVQWNRQAADMMNEISRNIDPGSREVAHAQLREILPLITDPRLQEQIARELS